MPFHVPGVGAVGEHELDVGMRAFGGFGSSALSATQSQGHRFEVAIGEAV
jgi:hypothetical protein